MKAGNQRISLRTKCVTSDAGEPVDLVSEREPHYQNLPAGPRVCKAEALVQLACVRKDRRERSGMAYWKTR